MKVSELKNDLKVFLFTIAVLTTIGLVFIYSSSSVFAQEHYGSPHFFLYKQLIFLIPSMIGFFAFYKISTQIIKKRAPLLFLASLVLLTVTILPFSLGAIKVHGAQRWLNFFGITVQPSEFLKLFLFIYLGFFLDRKRTQIASLANGYIPFLLILGICSAILFKQPDFGSVVTIFLTSFILFFIAEFRMMHLAITMLCALPLAVAAVLFKSYRLHRVLVFLNPWADAQGRGYQIIQSLIAIGSGHVWGLGISNSKQKFFYLPMQHTDFIFSIIAEETGFVGSVILIALFMLFCYKGIKIASNLEDSFAFFVTISFVILITLEAAINLMVATGLVPTKGLGLPFISYGGSALVANFCMMGLIANFVMEQEG